MCIPEDFCTEFVTDITNGECPCDDPAVALAFSICQANPDGSEKVRRGEDWLISGHNSTIGVKDAPHHHNVDAFVELSRVVYTELNIQSQATIRDS